MTASPDQANPLQGPGQPYGHAGGHARVVVAGRVVELPAFYHRVDCFFSVHLASYDAVREEMPSRELLPVRWFDGRAAIEVAALRYHDVTAAADGEVVRLAPYAEVLVAPLVSRHVLPPGVAMLASEQLKVGSFVADSAVTTAEGRDLATAGFGFPAFVADLAFLDAPTEQAVVVSDGDRQVLSLRVRPGGRMARVHHPWLLYSSLGGALLETRSPATGWRLGRTGHRPASLTLGDHPVAQRLRDLGLHTESLVSATYLGLRRILPAGHPVASARPWQGHLGTDRPRGRYVVDHGGTGPLDQAPMLPA